MPKTACLIFINIIHRMQKLQRVEIQSQTIESNVVFFAGTQLTRDNEYLATRLHPAQVTFFSASRIS